MLKYLSHITCIILFLFLQVYLLGWDNIPIGKEAKTCRGEWESCVGPLCAVILLDLAIITVINMIYNIAQFDPN